jgi:hypothetical protein
LKNERKEGNVVVVEGGIPSCFTRILNSKKLRPAQNELEESKLSWIYQKRGYGRMKNITELGGSVFVLLLRSRQDQET